MEKREYYDRVYGCWLGKNIGGTIGVPFEGNKDFLTIPFKTPSEMVANDDIDLQLVWLDILKRKGIKITADDLAEDWLNSITYAWDEYGVAIANLKAGLKPPVTGYYNNWFYNCLGAPIRSEIWACIAPGKPEVAGWYAWQDASVDHWDEGVYGEIFLAAMESAAFSNSSVASIIDAGLSFLPENSKVFQVVKLTLALHQQGKSLRETRESILEKFGHYNFTDCVQNIGFIIAGLLYGGGDFIKTIVSAVNCGYDADCTGATAGAIIGIIMGRQKIIKEGHTAGNEIVPGYGIRNVDVPATLKELTQQLVVLGDKVQKEKELPEIPRSFSLPAVPDFNHPFLYPVLLSKTFSLNETEKAEQSVLNGDYKDFKQAVFNSSFFDLNRHFADRPSAIFLKTTITLPGKRKIKLFPASTDGIKMWLDGKLILSHHQHNGFLPAPHRPGSPLVEVEPERGEHDILLEVMRCQEKLEFAWIVADENNHLLTGLYNEKTVREVIKQTNGKKEIDGI